LSNIQDFCQTASTLCFSFEIDPYGTGNIAKIFYKLETPQEAKDWFDLFELLAHNSIGTCLLCRFFSD
jgi:hypothetical protein